METTSLVIWEFIGQADCNHNSRVAYALSQGGREVPNPLHVFDRAFPNEKIWHISSIKSIGFLDTCAAASCTDALLVMIVKSIQEQSQ